MARGLKKHVQLLYNQVYVDKLIKNLTVSSQGNIYSQKNALELENWIYKQVNSQNT